MHEQRDGPKVVKSRQDEPIPGPREDFATVWHRPDATCDNTTSFSSRNLLSYPLPFNISCVSSIASDSNPIFSPNCIIHLFRSLPINRSTDLNRSRSLLFPMILSEKKIVEMKLEIESKERMRGKFKFFKYRFAITRGIIHRATYIATHTRRNAYPRISTTSARCLS